MDTHSEKLDLSKVLGEQLWYNIFSSITPDQSGGILESNSYLQELVVTNTKYWLKERIVSIDAGNYHSIFLTHLGNVYTFGANNRGQLGLGDFESMNRPTRVTTTEDGSPLPKIKRAYAIYDQCFLIDMSGNVYSFGDNQYGQLGLGDKINRQFPTLVTRSVDGMKMPKIKALKSGVATVFLSEDGRVYSCGWNGEGDLGLGRIDDIENNYLPNRISVDNKGINLPVIIEVGGLAVSLLLTEDGRVFTFGPPGLGYRLGLGPVPRAISPTQIIATFNNRRLLAIKAISGGMTTNMLLDVNGNAYRYGVISGRLGSRIAEDRPRFILTDDQGKLLKPMSKIKSSIKMRFYIDIDGKLYYNGNWGYGSLSDKNPPLLEDDNMPILMSKKVIEGGTIDTLEQLPKIMDIAAGETHILILTEDGKLLGLGSNKFGQLGMGDEGYIGERKLVVEAGMGNMISETIFGKGDLSWPQPTDISVDEYVEWTRKL